MDEIVIPIDRFIEHEEIWRAPSCGGSTIGFRRLAPMSWATPRVNGTGQTLLERALESGAFAPSAPRRAGESWMVDGQIRYRESGSLAPSIVRWLPERRARASKRLRGPGSTTSGPTRSPPSRGPRLEGSGSAGGLFADAARLREAFATSRLRPASPAPRALALERNSRRVGGAAASSPSPLGANP